MQNKEARAAKKHAALTLRMPSVLSRRLKRLERRAAEIGSRTGDKS
jgi:hypothetical protein